MSAQAYSRTKKACYFTSIGLSAAFGLPPMLFVTFREMYGISYTLLGTLVLINYCTQLGVDLTFSFFSHRFNIHRTVQLMPILTMVGMLIYALVPMLLPEYAYAGLVAGTIMFSLSSGLCEVLTSPIIAAIPSEHQDKDMSLLHSIYGWGLLGAIVIGSIFLNLFGTHNWMYLVILLSLVPLIPAWLFATSSLPPMQIAHSPGERGGKRRMAGLALCIGCIFLGGSAEVTMTNWISSYMETALHVSKDYGDIVGMALFAGLLATVRTLYSKYGRNIYRVLLLGMAGAAACYCVVGFSDHAAFSLLACVLTGCFTAMLWPGTLIFMEENLPNCGVVAYAMMAAGGDFGASVAPQLMGVVVDHVSASGWGIRLAERLALSPEQIGMKTGMLVSALFPLAGVLLLLYMRRYFAKQK